MNSTKTTTKKVAAKKFGLCTPIHADFMLSACSATMPTDQAELKTRLIAFLISVVELDSDTEETILAAMGHRVGYDGKSIELI